MARRIIKGVLVGFLPVAALWIFALWQRSRDPLGYGMAILPLILLSIVLFTFVFALSLFVSRRR